MRSVKIISLRTVKRMVERSFSRSNVSFDTKRKLSEKLAGSNNGNYGKRWITDGVANMKIKSDQIIPDGWMYGRNVKHIVGFRGGY